MRVTTTAILSRFPPCRSQFDWEHPPDATPPPTPGGGNSTRILVEFAPGLERGERPVDKVVTVDRVVAVDRVVRQVDRAARVVGLSAEQ